LLLARRERELLAAIGTGQGPVCCVQENAPARAASANYLAETSERSVVCRVSVGAIPFERHSDNTTPERG
jgi:hypothetical protein